jgi:phosphatidate cytidylyltransferase
LNHQDLVLRALAYWVLLPLLGLSIGLMARKRGSLYFLKRLKVWMLVVPLFLAALYLGQNALAGLLALGCLGGAWELARLDKGHPAGFGGGTTWMLLLCLPWPALAYLDGAVIPWAALVCLVLPLTGLRPFAVLPPRWLLPAAALSLGAGLYFWVYLAATDLGLRWLVLAFTVVTVNDMLAAVFGKFIKSWQPFPSLSPQKSLAGYLGGALCGVAAGFALAPGFPQVSAWGLFARILVLVAAGDAGDLFASWLKRGYGRKDFGRVLGDMSGTLDRLDSLLPAGALVFIMLYL